jgi:ammonium transporter, Amt family
MWVCLDIFMGKNPSSVGACNGIVVGLVAITPGCGYVTTGASLVIGAVTTIVCYFAGNYMKTYSGIDDTIDVFAVHGLGTP